MRKFFQIPLETLTLLSSYDTNFEFFAFFHNLCNLIHRDHHPSHSAGAIKPQRVEPPVQRLATGVASAAAGKDETTRLEPFIASMPVRPQLLRAVSAGTVLADFSCTREEEFAADNVYVSIML
jgi:hypothetical protein